MSPSHTSRSCRDRDVLVRAILLTLGGPRGLFLGIIIIIIIIIMMLPLLWRPL